MKKNLSVVGIAVVVLSVAACSSPQQQEEKATAKVDQAAEDVCADLEALGVALANYGDINADTSVADVKRAQVEVDGAWNRLADRVRMLDKAEAKAMSASYEVYVNTVNAIPETETLGEASDDLAAALNDLVAKQTALQDVECPD